MLGGDLLADVKPDKIGKVWPTNCRYVDYNKATDLSMANDQHRTITLMSGGNRMSISALGQSEIPTVSPRTSGEVTQYKKTCVKSSQTANVEICTAEGDKVTLSAEVQYEATSESSASYERLGRAHGSHHHRGHGRHHVQRSADSTSISSTQKYSVSVEGDLNQQELQDIQKALRSIDQASAQMQSGNLDKAQDKLEKLGDLKSLAGLSASISVQKSVKVETGVSTQSAA